MVDRQIQKSMMNRSYNELSKIESFEGRLRYLQLSDRIGNETFGFDRYLNQVFYKSKEWKRLRDQVIVRDNGCDLGITDMPIKGAIYIHHINPIMVHDVIERSKKLFDLDNLVCCSFETHEAIHYSRAIEEIIASKSITERTPNDTIPWKK